MPIQCRKRKGLTAKFAKLLRKEGKGFVDLGQAISFEVRKEGAYEKRFYLE